MVLRLLVTAAAADADSGAKAKVTIASRNEIQLGADHVAGTLREDSNVSVLRTLKKHAEKTETIGCGGNSNTKDGT